MVQLRRGDEITSLQVPGNAHFVQLPLAMLVGVAPAEVVVVVDEVVVEMTVVVCVGEEPLEPTHRICPTCKSQLESIQGLYCCNCAAVIPSLVSMRPQ